MIEVENLHKAFGGKRAVDGVSFSVAKGEVLGFLGPNGAGKSTTMRMVTGFYPPPTTGRVRIGGIDLGEHPVDAKRKIGYLPENAPSYPEMDVEGFLTFVAELRGLRGERRDHAVEQVVRTCFLMPVRFQTIETLSKGYRHRVGLAQAIVHDPEVLILDEPTDGLDPNQKHEVRCLIREMGKSKAIIFSTHILEEVESTCTRALVIDRGKVVAEGTPAGLKARRAGVIEVRFVKCPPSTVIDHLRQLDGVCAVSGPEDPELGPPVIRLETREPGTERKIARAVGKLAAKEKCALEELRIVEPRLDDVFREMTTGDDRS